MTIDVETSKPDDSTMFMCPETCTFVRPLRRQGRGSNIREIALKAMSEDDVEHRSYTVEP